MLTDTPRRLLLVLTLLPGLALGVPGSIRVTGSSARIPYTVEQLRVDDALM